MARTVAKSAKTKTIVSRTKKQTSEVTQQNLNVLPGGKLNNFLNNFPKRISDFRSSKNFYIILAIVLLLFLAIYKKNWFVAAMVNGQPITNLELQMQLNKQFRSQTLNQMVNEKVILDEARKMAALPTEAEINNKIAELEKNVGGKEVLDNLLSQQGQTRESIRTQIKIQLAITKMYEKQASVSAEEVAKFIQQNSQVLTSTDSASQEKEATETLKNQKLSQIFNQKFQDLKNKARIQLF